MTKDTPLVSVAIAAYNHAQYIEKALDSILKEDYPNIEVIILDDGSTDNTEEVVIKWQKENSYQLLYIKQTNAGISKTLNRLIDLCNGEYLAFLSSDDYLLNNSISKRVKYLQQNPQKCSVFADSIVVDNNNNKTMDSAINDLHKGRKENFLTDKGLRDEVVRKWAVAGPTRMDKPALYKKIGKYDEGLFIDDWDFYLRTVSRDLMGFIDEPLAAYRVHNTNTSHNLSPQKVIRNYKAMRSTLLRNFWRFDISNMLYMIKRHVHFTRKILKIRLNILKQKYLKNSKA